ncbi:MAG TPA: hypothetical protein VFK85_10725 [Anaeromyxobacteraceae bacterium]|nr:hypothetical protein [Anaeromyxobacteraceae bacterium]
MCALDSLRNEAARFHRRSVVLAALVLALAQWPIGTAADGGKKGSAEQGSRLFSGETHFARGGPSCAACHPVEGLPFPGGGTMGPDLTGAYAKFGPEALATVLSTLFFPTMNPVFAGKLLTPAEQADVQAFLAVAGTGPAQAVTGRLFLCGLLLLAAAVALIAWLGRTRLRGVRAALVAGARRRREARP